MTLSEDAPLSGSALAAAGSSWSPLKAEDVADSGRFASRLLLLLAPPVLASSSVSASFSLKIWVSRRPMSLSKFEACSFSLAIVYRHIRNIIHGG